MGLFNYDEKNLISHEVTTDSNGKVISEKKTYRVGCSNQETDRGFNGAAFVWSVTFTSLCVTLIFLTS